MSIVAPSSRIHSKSGNFRRFLKQERAFSALFGESTGTKPKKNICRFLSTTYYDSQSGLHLPVYDETEIRLILDARNYESSQQQPFVPHTLSKDRVEAEELSEKLQELALRGIHGVVLPAIRFPRDVRNLHTFSVIAPPGFVILSESNDNDSSSSKPSNDNKSSNSKINNADDGLIKANELSSPDTIFSKVVRYSNETSLREALHRLTDRGLHTTVSLTPYAYNDDVEPIKLASNIAASIDDHGGCDYIWVARDHDKGSATTAANSSDTMVEVCEELAYLDVAGATIKSRLLVDAVNQDVLEDVMFLGVNKYIIEDENQIELVESVANDQGKSLLRRR